MLIALMPETSKGSNEKTKVGRLAGILQEKDQIIEIVSPDVKTAVCTGPGADNVLSRLEHCQIAHFACYGISDSIDPSNSALVLQGVDPDGKPE